MVDVPATTDVLISDQKLYLDYTLTHQIIGFVDGVQHKLHDKLDANHLEASPKNIFLLLAQPDMDKLLEYTSESMNRSGARSVNRAEFIRFLGTICSVVASRCQSMILFR